jgi:lipopolysaccharide transport system permease protein
MNAMAEEQVTFSNAGRRRFSWARCRADLMPVVTRSVTWRALAFGDIRSKYRRTFLGPWWITATNGITALIMGLVSGRFLGADMSTYLPHFIVSMTIWNFISSSFSEACFTLISAGGMIKAVDMPIIIHVMRMVQRNFIIFLHNIAIVPLIWLIYPWQIDFGLILAVLGFALIYPFVVACSIIISMICVRYRDVPPIVASMLQVLFFISPIIWIPSQVHGSALIVALNPIAYLLAITSDPIMSNAVPASDWIISVGIVVAALALSAFIYTRYRARVVFWA